MKRIFLILIIILSTCLMMAQEMFTIGKYTFTITSSAEVEIARVDTSLSLAYLSPSITYQGVTYQLTSIGDEAFYGCSSLTMVAIPEGVTSIGNRAFSGCSSLTSVTIPYSVKEIGWSAFRGTQLNRDAGALYIDNCLVEVDTKLLGDYTIKPATRLIADGAFFGCSSLTSVTIPGTVTSLGEGAFMFCKSLTSVTIPNSITTIEYGTFEGCSSLTSITLPFSVTSIGDAAFVDCSSLTSVFIPDSVRRIGVRAFLGTGIYNNPSNWDAGALYINDCLLVANDGLLGDYAIKYGTRLIANGAFYDCSSLTALNIPLGVTIIGEEAFSGCSSLTSVNIPGGVTEIGDYAFYSCSSLTSAIIPEGVASIGNYAFSDCSSLASVVIPESVKEIGDGAFYACPLLETPERDEEFFMVVENMPEFPGGIQEMMKYIGTTLKYPVIAQENGIQGCTICQFVIEKDGRVTDIVVVRSSGDASLDKEAVRVLGIMPRWKPGKQRGKPVRVKNTIPVNFRMR